MLVFPSENAVAGLWNCENCSLNETATNATNASSENSLNATNACVSFRKCTAGLRLNCRMQSGEGWTGCLSGFWVQVSLQPLLPMHPAMPHQSHRLQQLRLPLAPLQKGCRHPTTCWDIKVFSDIQKMFRSHIQHTIWASNLLWAMPLSMSSGLFKLKQCMLPIF